MCAFDSPLVQDALQHVDQRRQPTVRDPFREAAREGLLEPAKRMAISAMQFGENMWNNQLVHVPADESEMPEEFARHYLTALHRTPEDVLAACRTLLARELAVDPNVRQAVSDETYCLFVAVVVHRHVTKRHTHALIRMADPRDVCGAGDAQHGPDRGRY